LSPVRLLVLALWIVVIIAVLLPLLRRRRSMAGGQPRIASDELVKDPVCGTYVVRSRAVSRPAAEGARYFCSAECAGRFAG
jgi:YHS domain-containing protein